MFAGLTAKLIAVGAVLALLVGGLVWFGSHERDIGAAGVQAQWDADKAMQSAAATEAQAKNAAQALDWTRQFAAISSKFETTTHAQAPSIADTVAADVDAGRLRLRDGADVCPGGGAAARATARSPAADAAATQALADRVQAAIAAVRAGDEADARERLLGAQVMALQAVLKAERSH